MKSSIKKIVSVMLIILLLLPNMLAFAEIKVVEHEGTLEEYLKWKYNQEELTDEFLASITELRINDESWEYIDGRENLVNLNLDILPKLTNLEEMYISHTALKSFDFNLIVNLKKLQSIELATSTLKEIKNSDSESVSGLEALKEIIISSTNENLKNLNIGKIPNLQKLSISISNLEELNISKELVKLENLEISAYRLKALNIPAELVNLINLNITCDSVDTIEIPESLINLKNLYINCENIENLLIPKELVKLEV